jgi:hypothetical protein
MGVLSVYFKDGRVFEYKVSDCITARAHMDKIWQNGYRSVADGCLQWYGPHYIDKMKFTPDSNDEVLSKFPDIVRGT